MDPLRIRLDLAYDGAFSIGTFSTTKLGNHTLTLSGNAHLDTGFNSIQAGIIAIAGTATIGGVTFGGVGIVCHAFEAQTFRPNRRQHLVFTQSRNPVYLKRDIAKFIAEGGKVALWDLDAANLEAAREIIRNDPRMAAQIIKEWISDE